MAAQAAAAPGGQAPGLDPEEARIVYDNYRRALMRKDVRQQAPAGVMIVGDQHAQPAAPPRY